MEDQDGKLFGVSTKIGVLDLAVVVIAGAIFVVAWLFTLA